MGKGLLTKLTQIDSWKRLIGRISTTGFWKTQFLDSPLPKALCWATRSLSSRSRRSDHWEILLYCRSAQEAQHLKLFSEVFREDRHARFKIMVGVSCKEIPGVYARIRKLLPFPEVSSLRAYLCGWDMIVVADHPESQLLLNPRICPTLYIGHGPANKSTSGSCQTRPYSEFAFKKRSIFNLYKKGQPLYSLMLEGEEQIRDLAVEVNPSLDNVIAVVGNMANDNVLSQTDRREEWRRQLGIEPDATAVFVLSTWRPECLIESVGDAFLEESRKLLDTFTFMVSVHPNEYVPQGSGQRVWGEYLRTQQKHGYIIREPDEDFVPYMVACDIVVTDHTCLADYAILLQKPIICVPVDHEYIWKGSITWQLYQFAPILNDMRDLHETLLRADTDYPFGKLAELASSMNPYPGEAAERIRKEVHALLQI